MGHFIFKKNSHHLNEFYLFFVLTLAGSALAFFYSTINGFSGQIEALFIPNGPDSFYHSLRIIEAVENNSMPMQYDPRLNAPYGAYITWPWGFDWLMAQGVSLWGVFDSDTPIQNRLVLLAPFWGIINTMLIYAITLVLRFPLPYRVITLICFALSPLTQELHRMGRVDHHMLEFSFVLAFLGLSLKWFTNENSKLTASLLGGILGTATAFHNGLFILQIPIIVTLFFIWLKKRSLPCSSAYVTLLLISLTFFSLLPSEMFQKMNFTFYWQSWFHLYVACCSSLVILYFLRIRFSIKSLVGLCLLGFILLLPLLQAVSEGVGFMSGNMYGYHEIAEVRPPIYFQSSNIFDISVDYSSYSSLIFLLPLSMAICVWWVWKSFQYSRLFFLVYAVFGVSLMLIQHRFHYFGSFMLYLPFIIVTINIESKPVKKYKMIVLIILFVICYLPSLPRLYAKLPLGGSVDYEILFPAYEVLEKLCNDSPGIVLTDHELGHFVRYHTQCSVITSNMFVSPQDFERLEEEKRLFKLTPNEIIKHEAWIDYILVRRQDNIFKPQEFEKVKEFHHGLRGELLFNYTTPTGYLLVYQLDFNSDTGKEPLAKIYRLNHDINKKNN